VVALAATAVALGGLVVRLASFGRYGFWNDEAWVALTTRVDSIADFWLAVGPTPLGWAALLRPLAPWNPPEVWLRLLPLLFGIGTLWLAWRLGTRAGSSALPGLIALTVVAFDPVGVGYAKELKQYSAEAFFALLACDRLVEAVRRPSRRATVTVACLLALGLPFSNAQLFVAPPVAIVLLGDALARRDSAAVRRAIVVLVGVGLAMAAWFVVVMAPHLPPRLVEVFAHDFVPRDSVHNAAAFVWAVVDKRLGLMMTPLGWKLGAVALVIAVVVEPAFRPLAAALVLLVVELVLASIAGRVPFATARVSLFLFTTIGATLGAALGCVVARAHGRAARIAACVVVLAVVADLGWRHDWRRLTTPVRVEDVGALIRQVEAERGPDDVVLVYGRTRYVWAYYQRPTPRLDPAPGNAAGYVPHVDDRRVRLVDARDAPFVVPRAYADASVVWFVGSRMGDDASRIEGLLRRFGDVTARAHREDALLVRLARRAGATASSRLASSGADP
jgi:hypothetical protein